MTTLKNTTAIVVAENAGENAAPVQGGERSIERHDFLLNRSLEEMEGVHYGAETLKMRSSGFKVGDKRRYVAVCKIVETSLISEMACPFWYFLEGRISEVNADYRRIVEAINDLHEIFPSREMNGWQSDTVISVLKRAKRVVELTDELMTIDPPVVENSWPQRYAAA